MSHNIAKINGKYPNNSGSIPVPIHDLGNVSTIENGQTIVYNQALDVWEGQDMTGGTSGFGLAIFGQGESNDYSNSGFGIAIGETWGFYDSDPYNLISDKITYNYVLGTYWLESFTLEPGSYEVMIQTHAEFSASGYIGIALFDSTDTQLHQIALIGGAQPSSYGHPNVIAHNITVTESTTIKVKLTNSFNVSAAQGDTPAKRGLIFIRSIT